MARNGEEIFPKKTKFQARPEIRLIVGRIQPEVEEEARPRNLSQQLGPARGPRPGHPVPSNEKATISSVFGAGSGVRKVGILENSSFHQPFIYMDVLYVKIFRFLRGIQWYYSFCN